MLIGDKDKPFVRPCNDGAEESPQTMTLETELVDMRPDMRAALNIVLGCHGHSPVPNSQIWELADWNPSALVHALMRDSQYYEIADRSDLIAIQLWNVFLMRECQSSALMPQAARVIGAYQSAANRIPVTSSYPVDFAQAVLERFHLAQCTVIRPKYGEHVDAIRYGWHAAGIRLRYPGILANTCGPTEYGEALQDAA